MGVIGSLRSGFLSILEVIHFVFLPIQHEILDLRILSGFILCSSMIILDSVKRDP